jgi:hypothetical protein
VWLDGDSSGAKALQSALISRASATTQAALIATLEAKIPAACELAAQARRFLLVTWMREHANKISKLLSLDGTPNYVITGEMSHEQREKVAKRAAEEKVGIVATLDSVWQSMDSLKHVASVGIMHALHYQWLKMAQGEARLHRIGQTDPVHWYYLACRDTIDELIVRQIVEKMDQFRATIDSATNTTSLRDDLVSGGEEDMRALYEAM